MEDRKDLLTLLLDGLEAKERDHVERAIRLATVRPQEQLREEPVEASLSST